MAEDRFITKHYSPSIAWIAIGVLLVVVIGLLATYALRPGRSSADDAKTAAAISKMDAAQADADARREETRSATSRL